MLIDWMGCPSRVGFRVFTAFLCFIAFCVANVLVVAHPHNDTLAWVVLLIGGSICGFGASFLWTAQGETGLCRASGASSLSSMFSFRELYDVVCVQLRQHWG